MILCGTAIGTSYIYYRTSCQHGTHPNRCRDDVQKNPGQWRTASSSTSQSPILADKISVAWLMTRLDGDSGNFQGRNLAVRRYYTWLSIPEMRFENISQTPLPLEAATCRSCDHAGETMKRPQLRSGIPVFRVEKGGVCCVRFCTIYLSYRSW